MSKEYTQIGKANDRNANKQIRSRKSGIFSKVLKIITENII